MHTARGRIVALTAVLTLLFALCVPVALSPAASAAPATTAARRIVPAHTKAGDPALGPNVYVFDPSMPVADIQATVDAIAAQQLTNQFGTERYALLFKPGTYGSAATPLNFQVGYYTEVAGLGRSPGDVTINGSVDVRNQCDAGSCVALNNFWRSLSNLTIRVTTPDAGCYSGEFWAVSQAAPMRRVDVIGNTTLMDYCTGPSYASGGFIADSRFDSSIVSGSQQQFVVRNSALAGWSNGVWNQVFSGTTGAPAEVFPATASAGPYTTVAATPASREKPYLYVDGRGTWRVFVPSARTDSTGITWADGPTPGRSLPLSDFYVARPGDPATRIAAQLARGRNLLLTPGVYDIDHTLTVKRRDAVVLGLGLATLTARRGAVALAVADVPGVDIAGLVVDAGAKNSPALVRVGSGHGRTHGSHRASAADPTALQDLFLRVGGPHAGKATVGLEVNSDHVVLDDIWAWRADHGTGVGWTQNTSDTGVLVHGNDVTATGLFVEHFQKFQTSWTGARGTVIFFQSEMAYDVPSQAAWMSDRHTRGYAAVLLTRTARQFRGYGMGTYSFFNQGVDIVADHAYEVRNPATVHLHDLLTVFLDPSVGRGGIAHVVNDTGGSSTAANPSTPVTVVDFPG